MSPSLILWSVLTPFFFGQICRICYAYRVIRSCGYQEVDMTGEEMERAIEFLMNHHAQVSTDISRLKEVQEQSSKDIIALDEAQAQTSRDVQALASNMAGLTGVVVGLADAVSRLETQMEMRNSTSAKQPKATSKRGWHEFFCIESGQTELRRDAPPRLDSKAAQSP